MKYYQVNVSAEPKVIGVTNGIYQIEIDKESMKKDERYADFLGFFAYKNKEFWESQEKIKTFKIPVIGAKPLKKAKVTDIMGYAENITFLNKVYSERYINILKAFNIGNYTTFEVAIENVKEKYFMLFIETIVLSRINFERSVVYTGHAILKNIEYFNFKNYDEYWEFLQNNPLADFEKISISKEHLGRDIINTQASALPFYSEKLIDFLLDCGITGIQVIYNNSIELDFY